MVKINFRVSTGAKVLEGVAVQNIQTKNNAVSSVVTDKGTIDCEIFVNCTGQVLYPKA